MKKSYNAQKKPLDSMKGQIENLLEDLGVPVRSPYKKVKADGAFLAQQSITDYTTSNKRKLDGEYNV